MKTANQGTGRKLRSDSKLGSLAPSQRTLVEKWLFDKGMTYQEVADACPRMFGLKVSRSSVARYAERVMAQQLRKVKPEADEDESVQVGAESHEWAGEMQRAEPGAAFYQILDWLTKWALEELRWPEPEDADVNMALRVVWLLMEARREANDAAAARLAWDKFELKAAKACLDQFKIKNLKFKIGKTKRRKATARRKIEILSVEDATSREARKTGADNFRMSGDDFICGKVGGCLTFIGDRAVFVTYRYSNH